MSTIIISGYPNGKLRLRWFNGLTLIATEEWRAVETEYSVASPIRTRVQRLDGLSVVFQTAPADPRHIELNLEGDGLPVAVAERIAMRYNGIDATQDWNALTLKIDDEYGNEWTVKMIEPDIHISKGRSTAQYTFKFFVEAAPTTLVLGYGC